MSIYSYDKNLPFCTYLTIYSGNKLPPFYIGYKDVLSVIKGYHGSVTSEFYKSIWLKELKENPKLFKTIILTYHETASEATKKESYFLRFFDAKRNPMYINRHNGGKDFYCTSHTEKSKMKIAMKATINSKKLHQEKKVGMYNKKHTEETKQKMKKSASNRYKQVFRYIYKLDQRMSIDIKSSDYEILLSQGWSRTCTKEYRRFITLNTHTNKTRSEEQKENIKAGVKKFLEENKRIWIHDNNIEKLHNTKEKIPYGWAKGRIFYWINNGEENKKHLESSPLPHGWAKGRIKAFS